MSTRERILKRDGFACQCCGLVRSDHEIDHRVPLDQGGSNGDSNLWTLCHACHASKTAEEAKARGGRVTSLGPDGRETHRSLIRTKCLPYT